MNDPQPDGIDAVSPARQFSAAARVDSLDVFRGLALLGWIACVPLGVALERVPAGGRLIRGLGNQLQPSLGAGLHLRDLMGPWFLLIAGVALVFSLKGFTLRYGVDAAVLRVGRRSLWFYLLGFFCAGGFSAASAGLPLLEGLQRVAICHGICGLAFVFFRLRTLALLGGLLFFAYWVVLGLGPTPPTTVGDRWAVGSSVVDWFDLRIPFLQRRELGQTPVLALTLIPSLVVCLMGLGIGLILVADGLPPARQAARAATVGGILVAVGGLTSFLTPMVPRLWSPPFVLVATGLGAVALAGLHGWIGGQTEANGWHPCRWLGVNSLAVYFLAQLIDMEAFASRFLGGNIQALVDRLTFAGLGGVAVAILVPVILIGIAGFLYRRRLYFRP